MMHRRAPAITCTHAAARDLRRRLESRWPASSSVRRILNLMDDGQLVAMYNENEAAGRQHIPAPPPVRVEFVPNVRMHLGVLRMAAPATATRKVRLPHRTALVSASLVMVMAICVTIGMRVQASRALIPIDYNMVVVAQTAEPVHEGWRTEIIRWIRERI